ncbi:MAG: helicase RepA family protein [Deltaproteobacteria bacterium]|jgi:RecA-family ATPase|nr:helicase RepA family protein [Deltaproteobacteria bacterium]
MSGIGNVFPNFPAGMVGSLISPGGTGKSTLALQLTVSVASGIDMLSF